MNLEFKYLPAYLSIMFFIGLFFINALNFDKENIGGPTTTLSHTNDVMNSTVCSVNSTNTNSIGVQSNGYWQATIITESPWVHLLDPVSGNGDGFARYQAEPNYTGNPRTATINIGGQEFAVLQNPYNPGEVCTVEADVTELRASSTGVVTEVHVNDWGLNLDWSILVPRGTDWILSDRVDGRGSGAANLSVIENPHFTSRMVVVVIGHKNIPVIQGGRLGGGR